MCVLYYPVLSHFHLLAIQFNYHSSIAVSCYCGHRVDSSKSSKRELDSTSLFIIKYINSFDGGD